MKLIKLTLALAAVLVVSGFSGCSTLPQEDQQVAAACASVSAGLKAITLANQEGKLSATAQTNVLNALAITDPVCTAGTPTWDSVTRAEFFTAATTIQTAGAQ